MIYNSNKKILCILVIIIILVILSIIVYLVYRSFKTDNNIKNNEKFDALDNYVPTNLGDPLSTNLRDDIIIRAQNTIYNLEPNLQVIKLISNIAGTIFMAACNDSSNGNNLAICLFDITKNKWNCMPFDNNHKNNPSTTLPEMNNNISCSKDSSILITTNSKTLFIYNEPYNLQKRLNCLYYSTHTLNCLALPSLNVPGTTSSSNSERASLSYDKMNFICANDRVLLGLSCSNILYYLMLNTSTATPDANSSWKSLNVSIPSIPDFNLRNVNFLGLNDYAIFLYYNDYTNPATLLYSPLNIAEEVLTVSLEVLSNTGVLPNTSVLANKVLPNTSVLANKVLPINETKPSTTPAKIIKPNFYSNGFAINNNVIFGLEKPDNSRNMNLWWCSLNTRTPSWKTMNLSNQGIANIPFNNLTGICIYNNSLIINYYTGRQNNLVIPLLSNSSNPTNSVSTTTSNNINAITTSTNPTQTSNNSSTNATTTTTIANVSNGTTTSPYITSTLLANTLVLGNTLTSNDPNNATISNTTLTIFNTTPNTTSNTTTNTTPNTTPNTTSNTTLTIFNTTPLKMTNEVNDGSPASLTDVGINGVNGNLGNKDNINDFMKDANLLGNNIYISPMNNDQLYNPQAKLSQLGKITSSFFPMIKIAQ